MSIVKFYNVENGDMSYIKHNSENFSLIDCNLSNEDKKNTSNILKEIQSIKNKKEIFRFISTHPDEDHYHGLDDIETAIGVENFYCVKNKVKKEKPTSAFNTYVNLRDSSKAFYIEKGSSRKWMNVSSEERNGSGINILWPDTKNDDFNTMLDRINSSFDSPNNISPIIKYSVENGGNFLWMGDLESDFIKKIENNVEWPKIDVLLAPHHGRKSGAIPTTILKKLDPQIIILGHADSEDMDYYSDHNTILKAQSGDITLECSNDFINIWVDNLEYESQIPILEENSDKQVFDNLNYIGSIKLK